MVTRQGAEKWRSRCQSPRRFLQLLLPVVSAFGIILARLCGERRLTAPLAVNGSVDVVLVDASRFVPTGTGCKEGAVIAVYLVPSFRFNWDTYSSAFPARQPHTMGLPPGSSLNRETRESGRDRDAERHPARAISP